MLLQQQLLLNPSYQLSLSYITKRLKVTVCSTTKLLQEMDGDVKEEAAKSKDDHDTFTVSYYGALTVCIKGALHNLVLYFHKV